MPNNRSANHATNLTGHSLSGYSAVVTGSSTGIGRAIAIELARAGADVLVHARQNRAAATEVVQEISQLGRQTRMVLCDLADKANCDQLVADAWNWREVDIWINNAGADVLTGDASEWPFEKKLEALWSVDVQATMTLSRDVGARMKARGQGVILNMGWDQAARGMEGDSGELFGAVKGAVMAFSLSLAKSLAPEVRVNCLAPGWIRTAWGDGTSDGWQNRACGESLLQRWGTPADVANVACFLASPAGAFVNGQVVPINGGFRNSSSKTAGDWTTGNSMGDSKS